MNKDKDLEELFLAQKPHFDDNEDFMASLNKRLEAVEYLKQHQEASIRRYKMAMVVAFVVGIISGGATIAYVLSTPAEVPLFTFRGSYRKTAGNHNYPGGLIGWNHIILGILFLQITSSQKFFKFFQCLAFR